MAVTDDHFGAGGLCEFGFVWVVGESGV